MCEFTQDGWKMYRYTMEELVFIFRGRTGEDFPKYGVPGLILPERKWWPLPAYVIMSSHFLWGYLKGRVYQNKPRTIEALKANITEEIQAVTADVLARTFQNMACRIQSCLDANGGHFQHTL